MPSAFRTKHSSMASSELKQSRRESVRLASPAPPSPPSDSHPAVEPSVEFAPAVPWDEVAALCEKVGYEFAKDVASAKAQLREASSTMRTTPRRAASA